MIWYAPPRRHPAKRLFTKSSCGHAPRRGGKAIDTLTLFGLFAVCAMLLCYALEARSPWFVLAFAGSCALGSVYGFLQGAWPFGLVEAVWSVVAAARWRRRAASDA